MRDNNLIWLDLEMTGLDVEKDRILEIAILITDGELNILSEGPVYVIHQHESRLSLMDEWNTDVHGSNGLLRKVRSSQINECEASELVVEFLNSWVSYKKSPICGNSISQDRQFLFKYMPKLEDYFSHRCLDVSAIRELMVRWRPDLMSGLKLHRVHRALEDIRESVMELLYYRKYFFNINMNTSY